MRSGFLNQMSGFFFKVQANKYSCEMFCETSIFPENKNFLFVSFLSDITTLTVFQVYCSISQNKFHLRWNSAAWTAAAALTTVQTPYVLALSNIEDTKIPLHFAVYLANIPDHIKKHNPKIHVYRYQVVGR